DGQRLAAVANGLRKDGRVEVERKHAGLHTQTYVSHRTCFGVPLFRVTGPASLPTGPRAGAPGPSASPDRSQREHVLLAPRIEGSASPPEVVHEQDTPTRGNARGRGPP